ncbi:unnamed protein product [Scytosiphon promiscuus]
MQSGEMDVSSGGEDPSVFPAFSEGNKATAAAEAAGAELGYQGWAARRLVLACHRIFVERGGNADLISESLQHRGMIYWCLSNINSEAAGPDAPSNEADLRDEDVFHDGLTDFYHVWTLAEAFLLDSAPLPAAPLLRWLKMYSQSREDEGMRLELDEAERVALEADDAGGSADPNAGYWNALRSLVVGVSPRRAAAMLRSHPEGRDNAGEVGAVARQLEKMPLLLPERADGEDACDGGAEAHLDREGFFETWTRWRKSCEAAAKRFGVAVGAGGGDRGGDGSGGDEERRQLRWLWGALCGERSCLVEGTQSWSGLFAAVLAFERPDTRKEEVASVMRECTRKHGEHEQEGFLIRVIRDASSGAVDSVLKFAREHGDTLALSACATHLVDLLSRCDHTSVTDQQRSWFFRRLADRLKALPCGGWELAAAYLGGGSGGDGDDEAELLRNLVRGVVPGSERATHELVGWCRANDLGEEAAAAVCRARGAAWLGKTGFSAEAMGTANPEEDGGGDGGATRVAGACGKAAYWLAKGGGGVQLERLCAEVSERLMVEVSPRAGGTADVEAQRAVLAEAEGVLAAITPGVTGPELSFLERYKDIADLLSAEAARSSPQQQQQQQQQGLGSLRGSPPVDTVGPGARLAGAIAVDMLAPRGGSGGGVRDAGGGAAEGNAAASGIPEPPSRSWAHLLRLSVPALKATTTAATAAAGEAEEEDAAVTVTAAQVHALLGKLQLLLASERRVGSVRGGWGGSSGRGGSRNSTLDSAPAPYGFRRNVGGGGGSGGDELLEVRRALANCLAATMMVQNAEEASPGVVGRGRRRGDHDDLLSLGAKRLPAEALVAPRVAV